MSRPAKSTRQPNLCHSDFFVRTVVFIGLSAAVPGVASRAVKTMLQLAVCSSGRRKTILMSPMPGGSLRADARSNPGAYQKPYKLTGIICRGRIDGPPSLQMSLNHYIDVFRHD